MTAETFAGAIRSSEGIEQVCAALAAAQAAYPSIRAPRTATIRPKDSAAYSFAYANLGDMWAQVRDALGAAELAVVAGAATEDRAIELTNSDGTVRTVVIILVTVTSRLVHSSGQWFEVDVLVEAADGGPRAVAAAIAHGRKAGFQLLCGVSPDEEGPAGDGDGDAAKGRQHQSGGSERGKIEEWCLRLEGLGMRDAINAVLSRFAPGAAGTLTEVLAAVPDAKVKELKAALWRAEHPEA